MNAEDVTAYLREAELDTARVRHGVRAHRIVYRTVGPDGAPTTASHLLAVPLTDEHVLAQAMWMHGTTVHRGATASMTDEPPDRPTAFAIAAAGYAVTAPDYLGLGQSEDLHPYNHLPSTVSASLDALRASREVLRAQRIGLEREVMVTGHSQGAAATLAVGRALPAAHGDDEVPMANAQHCRNVIREHGGRAEVVDVGDVDHQTSARLALPEVIAQFDEQRR